MQDIAERKHEGNEFHSKVLSGDLTVSARLAEAYLFSLVEALRRRYFQLGDPHYVETAVEDAILSYLNRPGQFDPSRGKSLFNYLLMSAEGDLRNLLAKQDRHLSKTVSQDLVELSSNSSELPIEATSDFEFEILLAEQWESIRSLIDEVLPDLTDQIVLVLMMEGERRTPVFSDVLGLDAQPVNVQKRQVKQAKDRIKKAITRRFNAADFKND